MAITNECLVHPADYEKSLRRERYIFVKEKIGWGALVERLSSDFYFETQTFLRNNLLHFNRSAGEWMDALRSVFHTALELEGQLLLWDTQVEVIWPHFGDKVDRMLMITEGGQEEPCDGVVRATIFPGIVQKGAERMERSGSYRFEGLVFRALVMLQ